MKKENTTYGQFTSPRKRSKPITHDWEQDYQELQEKRKIKALRKEQKKADKLNKKAKKLENQETEKPQKQKKEKPLKVKYPISGKLIGMISAIVIISMGTITFLVSYFVSTDTRINAEENNLTMNIRTASDCENRISTVQTLLGMFLDLIQTEKNDENATAQITSTFFERNTDIAAVLLPDTDRSFINASYLSSYQIPAELFSAYLSSSLELVDKAYDGILSLGNASPFFNAPMLAIAFPISSQDADNAAVVFYSSQALYETLATGTINLSYLVDNEGEVLVHSDLNVMLEAQNYKENPMVLTMIQSSQNNEQVYYTDAEGNEYIGAYKKIAGGSCGVITVVRTSVVLEAVNATTRRNIYLTIAILSIAILIIRIFARSISIPLKNLTAVTNEINAGNFNTDLFDNLREGKKDEIGILTESTKNEREILNTVSSLTNRGVTDAVIKKAIDFDPHLKDITIFFSDIRGFTKISDEFNKRYGEKSAEQIIGFLNDYMSRMVECITISGGTVDKFEGDAIMACWGTLRHDNLDFELLPNDDPKKKELWIEHRKHVREDALNALKGTLAMRYALMKYNRDAALFTKEHEKDEFVQYKPHIKNGAGLNTGRATVGFMGCQSKMEFTAIGDAVNLASRTESSNKPCGTDILITEDTYKILRREYIRCPENNFTLSQANLKNEIVVEKIPVSFEVKGKGEQHFYGVVNMPNFDIEEFFRQADPEFKADESCIQAVGPYGPASLADVRTMLGIPVPDFAGVNLDQEENKIQVKTK